MAAAIILLFPALLINLGLVAFYDDEAIRALVALEMQISGNYLTPTMFGELYYNKPPLYNWILLTVFEITGRNDEFISRLITVFFLLVYAGSVYYFFGKNSPAASSPKPPPKGETPTLILLLKNMATLFQISRAHLPLWRGLGGGNGRVNSPFTIHHSPLINALALITCGRILFWDSMLGLIDICFSWVMFLLFMVIYQEGEKRRYGRLFGWAYLLAAIGFMLKGLPAVAFLGIALLTYFIWQKKIRQLFSWRHMAGAMVFVIIVGSYYFLYAQENGLAVILETIFNESAKRTFIEYGLGDTLLHLVTFPFEMWGHFLPWTLLLICFFRKNILKTIKENKFITWNLLVFFTTVLPYWSSVEVYPRYLFMHVPLVFSALFYFYLKSKEEKGWQSKAVEMVFFAGGCLTIIVALLPIGWEKAQDVPFLYAKSIGIAGVLAVLAYFFWKWENHRILVFVLVLLTARTGYNFFILPSRVKIECSTQVRQTTQEAIEIAAGKPIYIYKESMGFQPMTGYYFTRETKNILREKQVEKNEDVFYLVHPGKYDASIFKKHVEVKVKWECSELWLMGKRRYYGNKDYN